MRTDPIHIVLVEDNPLHRRLVERFLEGGRMELTLESFPGLTPALKRLGRGGVSLVFLDLILPETQGLETLARVRACVPDVPVVVLTGLDDMGTAVRALEAGAQDYVLKDKISAARLERAIRYVLERTDTRAGEWNAAELRLGHQQFLKAAQMLQISDELRQRLLFAQDARLVSFAFRRDPPGQAERVFGYRVQHFSAAGPTMGGVYFGAGLNLGALTARAARLTWQFGMLQVPLGGACGGVRIDPTTLSAAEFERIVRRYTTEFGRDLGARRDIICASRHARAQLAGWVLDAYRQQQGRTVAGVVTGRAAAAGGAAGARRLAGRGLARLVEKAAARKNRPLDQARCVLQGLDETSEYAASALVERGARVVAIGNAGGALYCADGLDFGEVTRSKAPGAGVDQGGSNKNEAEVISARELYEVDCDVLFLANPHARFGVEEAGRVRCQTLVEVASGLLNPDVDEILGERDILVMPDILAGAPDALLEYFEWCQAISYQIWPAEKLIRRLDAHLDRAFEQVFERADQERSDLRGAAMLLALEQVVLSAGGQQGYDMADFR